MAKLTDKQTRFCNLVIRPDYSQVKAYREAYNNETMSNQAVANEAQDLMKHPLCAPYIEELRERLQKKLDYSAKQSFDKLTEIQTQALADKKYSDGIKSEELKGKLASLYTIKVDQTVRAKPIVVATEEDKQLLEDLKDD